MDDYSNHPGGGNGHENGTGMTQKAARLSAREVTEADLRAINKYALAPLKAEDVFTFKLALCDNEVDRDFERFSVKALEGLRKLFLGKTGIKDHRWSADNQVARIYATEVVVHNDKTTKAGEPFAQLVAYCYMVKTASNADLIAEINGGIKKEVSVGCAVGRATCTICGKAYGMCGHRKGESYEKQPGAGKEICTAILDDPVDAYEFSFVAVPAQRNAGASKNSTGNPAGAPEGHRDPPGEPGTPGKPGEPAPNTNDSEKAAELALQAELAAIRAKNTYYN
jgi:hypothetical protein